MILFFKKKQTLINLVSQFWDGSLRRCDEVHTYQKLWPHFVMCASSIISKQIGLEEQKKH